MIASRSLLFFLLPIILNLLAPAIAQDDPICPDRAYYCWRCSNTSTYTPGDTYQENLNNLLSSFSTNTEIDYGFYNSSLGQDPDKVNAIALCRGDLGLDSCQACLNKITQILFQNCSNQKEAIIWAEPCMVRYSHNLILGIEKEDPRKYLPSPNPANNSQQFNLVLSPLLAILSERAAAGDSLKKFAAGHAIVPGGETIYSTAQCTPDIDKQNCSNCLKGAVSDIPACCAGKQGARVLKPSCNLRYEASLFYESTAGSLVDISVAVPVPAGPAPKQENKSNRKKIIIIVVVVLIVFVTIITSICIFLRLRKRWVKLKLEDEADENSDDISFVESLQYDFDTIRSATDDFSEVNKLGQGGFGAVYKGRLPNGQPIAVKRLSKNSEQGDREFKNEVMLLAQLHHRNLVKLLGFSLKSKERLLIYEYVANASLDHFIFDPNNHAHLEWKTRYKIIGGIARGILYLHEDSRVRIIHRDLKASNILMDKDMNPKIADFGMARLFVIDQTQGDTRTIVGTYGYMAPEYVMHGRFSVKSDVYSFGVLVLEIVSGQKISCFRRGENVEHLLSYAWKSWREGTASNLIDPTLRSGLRTEIMRCIHIGLLCVQRNIAERPTMISIVLMLNSHSATLPRPSQPAFFEHSSVGSDMSLGCHSNSGVSTGSDRSKSNSVKAPKKEVSLITQVYAR